MAFSHRLISFNCLTANASFSSRELYVLRSKNNTLHTTFPDFSGARGIICAVTLLDVLAKRSCSSMIFCTRPWKSLHVGQAESQKQTCHSTTRPGGAEGSKAFDHRRNKNRCIHYSSKKVPLILMVDNLTKDLLNQLYFSRDSGGNLPKDKTPFHWHRQSRVADAQINFAIALVYARFSNPSAH